MYFYVYFSIYLHICIYMYICLICMHMCVHRSNINVYLMKSISFQCIFLSPRTHNSCVNGLTYRQTPLALKCYFISLVQSDTATPNGKEKKKKKKKKKKINEKKKKEQNPLGLSGHQLMQLRPACKEPNQGPYAIRNGDL